MSKLSNLKKKQAKILKAYKLIRKLEKSQMEKPQAFML
jgi:hypothetical protein